MKLIDPTGAPPKKQHARAPALTELDGKVVGIISNRKANANLLLQLTADRFAQEHGCSINEMAFKRHASEPTDITTIKEVAAESDFLLTANGD